MEKGDLTKYVELYFEGRVCDENDEKIRDYFLQRYIAEHKEEQTNPQEPDLIDPQKNDESSAFYKKFMEDELNKYKEKLKSIKPEKIINDFKPTKRNPNEFLLDIGEEFVIQKKGNWANLCILDYQEKLLQVIRNNQVTIVKGFTGCGKSTQIPQYIAVDCQNRGQAYNIIVTQPRRVAAKMLATRVSYELNCTVGSLVGYQIGLDKSKDSKLTKILYCTTGVLLQRLIMSSNLNFFTHIILDEIHERSADMDMLFLILKKKIFEDKLNAKLVLMSATCDVDLFQHYFTFPSYIIEQDCYVDICPAVIEIYSSRRGTGNVYRQEIFYLDDIVGKIGSLKFNYSENLFKYTDFDDFLMSNADENIIFNKQYPILHKILHDVVLGILFHGIEIHQTENQTRGTILIFLPGLAEILELLNALQTSPYCKHYKWKFFILHSTVSLKEQTEVMKASTDGSRHIILATNIAESSLTVPNVEYVIDFCLCKTLIASRQGYNMTYLSLEWSSKSSSDQRAGRTGRTNHGQVFRLIPNHFYQTLNEYEIPEFEKTPLENYVLKAKLIDDHIPPKNVLAFALNPPKLNDIEQAVLTLKRIGAFTVYMQEEREEETKETEDGEKPSKVEKGQLALVVAEEREEQEERRPNKKEEVKYIYEKEDGNLTALGYIMALLPLDIMLSKLVALGLVFDVSFETIVIAAAHCTSGFFMKNAYDPLHTFKSHLAWSNRSLSDSLAYLKAYRMFKSLESKFTNSHAAAQKWCFRNNIEYQRLLELETLICEIVSRLEMNLKIDTTMFRRTVNKKAEQDLVLKVVLSGAFYPNYFTREFINEELIERYQSTINCENTVIMSGFDRDSIITTLYIPYLKKMFDLCSANIDFKIDGNVVFMTLDANTYEISIESEDHPLYLAVASHVNTQQQIGQNKEAPSKSWSTFHETNVHTSVFLALAFKKFMRNQITLNRYRSTIENFHKTEILNKIKANYNLSGENNKAAQALQGDKIVAKVCQNPRKYMLPHMPSLRTSTLWIGVRVTNFITPHLFFVLYKHSYVDQMLYNIDVLAQTLEGRKEEKACKALLVYSGDKSTRPQMSSSVTTNCDVGDLVLAPLNIDRHGAIAELVNAISIDIKVIKRNKTRYILARAEVLKLNNVNYQAVACVLYIDFGITDTVLLSQVHHLECRFKYTLDENETARKLFTNQELAAIQTEQDIFDKLFTIPPLAVRCELVRIKPFSGAELVGNWMPQVKKFMADYFARHHFLFKARIYAYLNDRLYLEMYPGREVAGPAPSVLDLLLDNRDDDNRSLNELLVKKKFAEFKLETDACQQMNYRRHLNNHHEVVVRDVDLLFLEEFELVFDADVLTPVEFQFDVAQLTVDTERQFTHTLLRIRGPLSPLEVKFVGMSRLNATKTVVVSTNSINAVALEPDITAKHARLLVAGEINLSEASQMRLALNNTTFMPNIMDFPAFMCLIFAPYVELRVNKFLSERSYGMPEEICGAICGVGFNPENNSSYDPDNDIDLFFDSAISQEDIDLINLLRYQISQFFYTKEQHITQQTAEGLKLRSTFSLEQNLLRRQRKCREILFEILNRTRLQRKWFESSDPTQGQVHPTYRWNLYGQDESSFQYREIAFRKFSESFFMTMNLKTAVLAPIHIPILNPEMTSRFFWENAVLNNLNSLDDDDFEACFDEETKLYICKLCMFCSFGEVELQAHKCSNTNTTHKEASYLFRQYYSIWIAEFDQMRKFTIDIIEDEEKNAEPQSAKEQEQAKRDEIFGDPQKGIGYEGSLFNHFDYQLDVVSNVKSSDTSSEVVCKDLYDVPVLKKDNESSEFGEYGH